jgi:hypothetical protein
MKKINLIILFLISCIGYLKAGVVNGPVLLCAGAQNQLYTSSLGISGNGVTIHKIKWTIDNGGTFVENGSATYEIFPGLNPLLATTQAHINWANANLNSKVFCEYTYGAFNITSTPSLNVQVGITAMPSISVIPDYICTSSTGSYVVSTSLALPVGANSYDWSVTNAVKSGTGASISIVPNNTSNIVVTLKYKSTTCNQFSNSAIKTILRTSTPPSAPVVSIQQLGTSCNYQAVANASTASGYFWSLVGPPSGSGFGGSNTLPLGDCLGTCTFSVYSRAKNDCGLSATTHKTQTVTAPANCMARIANANQNIDVEEEVEMKILNSENVELKNTFEIFPNPTENSFKITTPFINQAINVYVMDYKGQLIVKRQLPSGENSLELDASNLSSGLYFVKIVSEDNITINKTSKLKVIK